MEAGVGNNGGDVSEAVGRGNATKVCTPLFCSKFYAFIYLLLYYFFFIFAVDHQQMPIHGIYTCAYLRARKSPVG